MKREQLQLLAEAEDENQVDWFEVTAQQLAADGVTVPSKGQRPAGWQVLILEAANLAAKTIDEGYYTLKVEMAEQLAWDPSFAGVVGWTSDGTFAVYHPAAGTIHLHDPYEQIRSDRSFEVAWSGIRRQQWAFDTLTSPKLQRALAIATQPGRLWDDEPAETMLASFTGPAPRLP